MYEIFPMIPPRTKIVAPPLNTIYTVYLLVVTCAPPLSKFYTWRTHGHSKAIVYDTARIRSGFNTGNVLCFLNFILSISSILTMNKCLH